MPFDFTIDLTGAQIYLQDLFAQTPAGIIWILFKDGGWIILPILAFLGGRLFWLEYHKEKFARGFKFVLLAIDLPKLNEQSPKAVEHIFSHLSSAFGSSTFKEKWWLGKHNVPISLEIISIDGYIQFLVRCVVKYRDLVEAAIFAQYPDAEIIEVEDYTENVPQHFPAEGWQMWGLDFVLSKPNAYPIRTYPQFEHGLTGEFKDPMSSFLEALSRVVPGTQIWLQILLMPADDDWKESVTKEVMKLIGRKVKAKETLLSKVGSVPQSLIESISSAVLYGTIGPGEEVKKREERQPGMMDLTPGEVEVIKAIQFKVGKVAFETKIRVVFIGKKELLDIGKYYALIKGAFQQFKAANLNGFRMYGKTTPSADYFWERNKIFEYLSLGFQTTWHTRQNRLMRAYKKRSMKLGAPPNILNIEELATIFHFPVMTVKAPLVKKSEVKRAEPPFTLPTSSGALLRPVKNEKIENSK